MRPQSLLTAAKSIAAALWEINMTNHICMNCGTPLSGDEIALYKKLVFREASQFLCLDCLAANLDTTRDKLEQIIIYFHTTGICSLFAKW